MLLVAELEIYRAGKGLVYFTAMPDMTSKANKPKKTCRKKLGIKPSFLKNVAMQIKS